MKVKYVVGIVAIVLVIVFLADLWNTGVELKRQHRLVTSESDFMPANENAIYTIPAVLLEAYAGQAQDSNDPGFEEEFREIMQGPCYVPNKSDLIPCVTRLSPTKEIEDACVEYQRLNQEYRAQIVNANEVLLGLGKYGINVAGIKGKPEEFQSKVAACIEAIESYYSED